MQVAGSRTGRFKYAHYKAGFEAHGYDALHGHVATKWRRFTASDCPGAKSAGCELVKCVAMMQEARKLKKFIFNRL